VKRRFVLSRGLIAAAAILQIGRLLAAYLPQDPAASLDALLYDAWTQGASKAYDLYTAKPHVPMGRAARDAFAQKMLEIAQVPDVAAIALQSPKPAAFPKDKLRPSRKNSQVCTSLRPRRSPGRRHRRAHTATFIPVTQRR
jgi:hypothetical protein